MAYGELKNQELPWVEPATDSQELTVRGQDWVHFPRTLRLRI